MSRAPMLVAATVPVASIAWTIHLAAAPDPFAADAGLTVAVGLLIFSVVDAAGIVLSRGRWARWLGQAIVAAGGVLFVVTDGAAASYVAVALSAVALVGLTGPWLDGWIRQRPSVEGPGPRPMGVVFGALALVPLAGVASPAGLEVWHGVVGATGVVLAWGYARAMAWALWALRLALPLVAIPGIVIGPWGGAVLLAAAIAVVTTLAWSHESLLAVQPLLDRRPPPRIGTARGEQPGTEPADG